MKSVSLNDKCMFFALFEKYQLVCVNDFFGCDLTLIVTSCTLMLWYQV